MNYFEEKRKRQIERSHDLAEKRAREAKNSFDASNKMYDAIPFGQPILIGHHSEKADRSYRARALSKFEKGIELSKVAKYHEEKAQRLENPYAISSDDPEAVTKLKEKLTGILKEIDQVKEHNKTAKKIHLALYSFDNGTHVSNDNGSYQTYAVIKDKVVCPCGTCPIIDWKISRVPAEVKERIENYVKTGKLEQPELKEEDKKTEAWVLQNLNANKSRIIKRIDELNNLSKIEEKEDTVNDVTLQIDKEQNRVKLFFPGKPAPEIISKLKHNGFHWSKFQMCWMRMTTDQCIRIAEEIREQTGAID